MTEVPRLGGNSDQQASYRTPPHNSETEQALLGAILVNNEAMHRIAGFLRPEHFFEAVHGRIFAAATKLIERGQIADPNTLKNFFEYDGALTDIGGAQYLARLAASAVTVINATDYGRTIHDLHVRRELIRLGEDVVNTAYDCQADVLAADLVEENEQNLFKLAEEGQYDGGFQAFSQCQTSAVESMEKAYKREALTSGVATGLHDLDQLLGGLHASDLIVMAGRPGMGKTALATNIAFEAANARRLAIRESGESDPVDGAVVGFFSLEMSAEQLVTRILSEQTQIPSERLRRGKFDEAEFRKVAKAAAELSRLPFFIDDTPALSIAALRTRARRLKRTHNLSLVVVDYLQLMRPAGRSNPDRRVQELGEITQGLKALAKDLDLPVLALSQLSRAVEQREDKRPQLADLRESGAIEQDADVVMFIFREEYYLRSSEPVQRTEETDDKFEQRYEKWSSRFKEVENLADIIVSKQRHGPTGPVHLQFNRETTKFQNFASQYSHTERSYSAKDDPPF